MVSPGAVGKGGMGKKPVRVVVVEKTDKEISACWKNTQILTYLIVVISGIAAAKSIGDIVYMFQDRCIFNATLSTRVDELSVRWIMFDSYDTCRWGDVRDCDFSQFYPVASMAVAATLATFFAMCGRGGDPSRNLPQPWRIVPIAFLFNLIFVAVSCAHVKFVFEGFASFCRNIIPLNNASIPHSCEDLYTGKTPLDSGTNFADNVIGARIFAVTNLVGWVLGLVLLIVRCSTHADFNVMVERQSIVSPEKCFNNIPIAIEISQYKTPSSINKNSV